jgi:glutaredoxin
VASLNGGKTDDDKRKEFAEKKKYRRLDEDEIADFETVVDIDDPYALMEEVKGGQISSDSDEEFKVPQVKSNF